MASSSAFAVRTAPPLTLAGWLRHDRIRRLLPLCGHISSVLEIGPGEGALAVRLASAYDYTGVEPDVRSYEKTRRRLGALGRGDVVLGDVAQLAPDRYFSLVCAFEVLEHIEKDGEAVREWSRRLEPAGALLLTVPAGSGRFGPADAYVGHYRRYEPASLRRLFDEAGLTTVRVDQFGFPLAYLLEDLRHLVAALSRHKGSREQTGSGARWLQPPDALAWTTRLASAPFRVLDRWLPAGTPGPSLVGLARADGDTRRSGESTPST